MGMLAAQAGRMAYLRLSAASARPSCDPGNARKWGKAMLSLALLQNSGSVKLVKLEPFKVLGCRGCSGDYSDRPATLGW